MNVLPDISESLINPLLARAHRGEELAIKGLEFLKEKGIEARWHNMSGDPGCYRRSEIIDRVVQKFIEKHPDARILNIGCGFCTRFYRLDNGRITWTELDLPHVIDLREQVYRPERRHLISAQNLTESQTLSPVCDLLIAEGLLMYLEPGVVKATVRGHHVLADLPCWRDLKKPKVHEESRKWFYEEEEWDWQILNTWNLNAKDLKLFEFLASH